MSYETARDDAEVAHLSGQITKFLQKYPNVKMLNGGVPVSVEFGCIGLRQDDQPWLNWLNNWVAYHTDSGELPGLYRKIIGLPWVQAT